MKTSRKEQIQTELAAFGLRMEPNLGALNGEGHSLMDIEEDECVDPPDEHVNQLAFEWSWLEGYIPQNDTERSWAHRLAMGRKDEVLVDDAGLAENQLDDKYNLDGDGEHPLFTRELWRVAVADKSTLDGYWSWVEYMIKG